METTINRRGKVTQLSLSPENDLSAVIKFQRGYAKLFINKQDTAEELMIGDQVEVSFLIKGDE